MDMRTGMKKGLQALTAVFLGVSLLAGCTQADSGGTESVQNTQEDGLNQTGEESATQEKDADGENETMENEEAEEIKAKNFTYNEDNMDYRLVWSDEFDYEGLPDGEKWSYDVGGDGWGNQELQYYTDDSNAWVEDGKLILELRKEEKDGNAYTSARLVTKEKGDWTYGRIEVCAKLPEGVGTWPAIWMLPTDEVYEPWPASGEIDIMEHVGYDPGVINATIHTQSYNHEKGTQKSGTVMVEDYSEEFHVYAVEWLPDQLKFSVDGEVYFTYKPTDHEADPTFREWPFDEDMHLVLNIAYGGTWGGMEGTDDEALPARMEVEYVRVYQSPQVNYLEREDREVENPLLKADGKVLRDAGGTGEVVQLKGTNVGGYLFQEMWMTPTRATSRVTDEESIYATLTERFGQEEMEELVKTYQDNYFTEADFDYCKELGMNCLRLPFWYRNIVDENGDFYEDWYGRFDWFLEQAAERNMYVILDFHGAPGSQNGSDHSGKDGGDDKEAASEFFFGENAGENQELYYQIWEAIAERYKDNPWVAGYDLLNEPYCTYRYNSSLTDVTLHKLLWYVYDTAYNRIRAIDEDHVIIMEATWDPVDLPDPEITGWENIMYEYHNYLYDDYDNANGQQIANMEKKLNAIAKADYNVPSYMGEFAYFNNLDAWEEGIALINDSGVSWTTWTYKVISDYGNWGIRNQKNFNVNLESLSYEDIANAWSQVGISSENSGLREVLEKYYRQVYMTCQ